MAKHTEKSACASAPTPPAFLVGCHRSGTTLARYILDAHPKIACPPESKFLAGFKPFLEYPQALVGLQSIGCSSEMVYRHIRQFSEAIFENFAKGAGKIRWIDKTPNYCMHLDLLDKIFDKSALYLFITRHPIDTAISLEEMFSGLAEWQRPIADPDIASIVARHGLSRMAWVKYWRESYEQILYFASTHPMRSHIFSYEDLINNPQRTMGRALDFLGEKMPARLLSRAFTANHAPGFGDPKIRRTSGLERKSIGRWRSLPRIELQSLWEASQPFAGKLGYAIADNST